ncbi:MAG: bifunctional UDP-N-acetylglucosamine diphosphorylase/glucosamine-1-phosphate N-acetyltransferase GlmU [Oligoflexia bacterium]|nr:bifunctional UDP-N-acetylglucosamine diphosphorylase/glucosamine-1-phosphate N-acetyltransferase GlmU [Oligoflexia bacterium]
MSEKNTAVIVMAAGFGTRFKSKRSKLLHELSGKPLIRYIADTLAELSPAQVVFVLSHQKEEIKSVIGENDIFSFAEQKVLDGTGGAVRAAMPALKNDIKRVVIIPGDTPVIPLSLIADMCNASGKAMLVAAELDDPAGYGRVIINRDGSVKAIVEETDLDDDRRLVPLVNTSIYAFERKILEDGLKKIQKNSQKGEYYLTDIVAICNKEGIRFDCVRHDEPAEVLGPNNRLQLSDLARLVWHSRAEILMEEYGVTIIDPYTVYIDEKAEIASDVEIYPNVFIEGGSRIEEDVKILENCRIVNSRIAKGSVIGPNVFIADSDIGTNNKIGPFTYVRPKTVTSDGVKIGAYVETKNIQVGKGTKIPHLSYVGDASVGEKTNIGCGVITCNYDGVKKHKTTIGSNVFVGSDSQLIAPVTINDGAYVAAGSAVTHDVEKDDLAIARARQVNKSGMAARLRKKLCAE